jgi:hypothetical protein
VSVYGPLTRQDARRAGMFAARFVAESRDGEADPDPSDANLAKVFAYCSKPPPARLYDEIRVGVARLRGAG